MIARDNPHRQSTTSCGPGAESPWSQDHGCFLSLTGSRISLGDLKKLVPPSDSAVFGDVEAGDRDHATLDFFADHAQSWSIGQTLLDRINILRVLLHR